MEELKIAEMNQRHQAERKLASIKLCHQFATCHKGSEKGEDGATKPGEKMEDLPWESMKEINDCSSKQLKAHLSCLHSTRLVLPC